VLVLDEPTYSLDLVGRGAMTAALRAWPGGLLIASHDRAFLSAIGVDVALELGRPGDPAGRSDRTHP
jgi:ATPase subunit of ABC transporter with duplicated ATPase domains